MYPEMNEQDIQKAYELVKELHKGQVDKAGQDYIGHLERVSARMKDNFGKIAALLHDSVEDAHYPPEEIERQFGPEMRQTVLCLTHAEGEDYFDYVKRASQNKVARLVKISDLIDNSNLSRLGEVTLRDAQRQEKYNKALQMLLEQTES